MCRLTLLIALCLCVLWTARLHQSGKFPPGSEVHRGTTSWQRSSWRGEVLQPHIKASVNPRPQLPQMPQMPQMLGAHSSAQPQPDQNRADHGLATNTSRSPSTSSAVSPELAQVECYDVAASFFVTFWSRCHWSVTLCEMQISCVA